MASDTTNELWAFQASIQVKILLPTAILILLSLIENTANYYD